MTLREQTEGHRMITKIAIAICALLSALCLLISLGVIGSDSQPSWWFVSLLCAYIALLLMDIAQYRARERRFRRLG